MLQQVTTEIREIPPIEWLEAIGKSLEPKISRIRLFYDPKFGWAMDISIFKEDLFSHDEDWPNGWKWKPTISEAILATEIVKD